MTVKRRITHPDTFWIPSLDARSNLQNGDWVKIRFLFLASEEGQVSTYGERMWVEVESKHEASYRGILLNEPTSSDLIGMDTMFWFEPRHVIDIVPKSEQDDFLKNHGE